LRTSQERRDAAKSLEEGLRDIILLGGQHVSTKGAHVEDLHVVGKAVVEVEEERVLVPGEVPEAAVGAARVGDDDEAFVGERGMYVRGDAAGGVLVELRERPRRCHRPLL
jgi:hypothetical protein